VRLSELRDQEGRLVGIGFPAKDNAVRLAHELAKFGVDVTYEMPPGRVVDGSGKPLVFGGATAPKRAPWKSPFLLAFHSVEKRAWISTVKGEYSIDGERLAKLVNSLNTIHKAFRDELKISAARRPRVDSFLLVACSAGRFNGPGGLAFDFQRGMAKHGLDRPVHAPRQNLSVLQQGRAVVTIVSGGWWRTFGYDGAVPGISRHGLEIVGQGPSGQLVPLSRAERPDLWRDVPFQHLFEIARGRRADRVVQNRKEVPAPWVSTSPRPTAFVAVPGGPHYFELTDRNARVRINGAALAALGQDNHGSAGVLAASKVVVLVGGPSAAGRAAEDFAREILRRFLNINVVWAATEPVENAAAVGKYRTLLDAGDGQWHRFDRSELQAAKALTDQLMSWVGVVTLSGQRVAAWNDDMSRDLEAALRKARGRGDLLGKHGNLRGVIGVVVRAIAGRLLVERIHEDNFGLAGLPQAFDFNLGDGAPGLRERIDWGSVAAAQITALDEEFRARVRGTAFSSLLKARVRDTVWPAGMPNAAAVGRQVVSDELGNTNPSALDLLMLALVEKEKRGWRSAEVWDRAVNDRAAQLFLTAKIKKWVTGIAVEGTSLFTWSEALGRDLGYVFGGIAAITGGIEDERGKMRQLVRALLRVAATAVVGARMADGNERRDDLPAWFKWSANDGDGVEVDWKFAEIAALAVTVLTGMDAAEKATRREEALAAYGALFGPQFEQRLGMGKDQALAYARNSAEFYDRLGLTVLASGVQKSLKDRKDAAQMLTERLIDTPDVIGPRRLGSARSENLGANPTPGNNQLGSNDRRSNDRNGAGHGVSGHAGVGSSGSGGPTGQWQTPAGPALAGHDSARRIRQGPEDPAARISVPARYSDGRIYGTGGAGGAGRGAARRPADDRGLIAGGLPYRRGTSELSNAAALASRGVGSVPLDARVVYEMVAFLRQHGKIKQVRLGGGLVELSLNAGRRSGALAVRVRVLTDSDADASAVAGLDVAERLAETSRDPVSGQVGVVFGPGAFVSVAVLAQVVLHELVRVAQWDLDLDPHDSARELEATGTRALLNTVDWDSYVWDRDSVSFSNRAVIPTLRALFWELLDEFDALSQVSESRGAARQGVGGVVGDDDSVPAAMPVQVRVRGWRDRGADAPVSVGELRQLVRWVNELSPQETVLSVWEAAAPPSAREARVLEKVWRMLASVKPLNIFEVSDVLDDAGMRLSRTQLDERRNEFEQIRQMVIGLRSPVRRGERDVPVSAVLSPVAAAVAASLGVDSGGAGLVGWASVAVGRVASGSQEGMLTLVASLRPVLNRGFVYSVEEMPGGWRRAVEARLELLVMRLPGAGVGGLTPRVWGRVAARYAMASLLEDMAWSIGGVNVGGVRVNVRLGQALWDDAVAADLVSEAAVRVLRMGAVAPSRPVRLHEVEELAQTYRQNVRLFTRASWAAPAAAREALHREWAAYEQMFVPGSRAQYQQWFTNPRMVASGMLAYVDHAADGAHILQPGRIQLPEHAVSPGNGLAASRAEWRLAKAAVSRTALLAGQAHASARQVWGDELVRALWVAHASKERALFRWVFDEDGAPSTAQGAAGEPLNSESSLLKALEALRGWEQKRPLLPPLIADPERLLAAGRRREAQVGSLVRGLVGHSAVAGVLRSAFATGARGRRGLPPEVVDLILGELIEAYRSALETHRAVETARYGHRAADVPSPGARELQAWLAHPEVGLGPVWVLVGRGPDGRRVSTAPGVAELVPPYRQDFVHPRGRGYYPPGRGYPHGWFRDPSPLGPLAPGQTLNAARLLAARGVATPEDLASAALSPSQWSAGLWRVLGAELSTDSAALDSHKYQLVDTTRWWLPGLYGTRLNRCLASFLNRAESEFYRDGRMPIRAVAVVSAPTVLLTAALDTGVLHVTARSAIWVVRSVYGAFILVYGAFMLVVVSYHLLTATLPSGGPYIGAKVRAALGSRLPERDSGRSAAAVADEVAAAWWVRRAGVVSDAWAARLVGDVLGAVVAESAGVLDVSVWREEVLARWAGSGSEVRGLDAIGFVSWVLELLDARFGLLGMGVSVEIVAPGGARLFVRWGGGSSSHRRLGGVVSVPIGGAVLGGVGSDERLRAADVGWLRAVVWEFRVASSGGGGDDVVAAMRAREEASSLIDGVAWRRDTVDRFSAAEVLAAAVWRWGAGAPRVKGVLRHVTGVAGSVDSVSVGERVVAGSRALTGQLLPQMERWVTAIPAHGGTDTLWDPRLQLAVRAVLDGAGEQDQDGADPRGAPGLVYEVLTVVTEHVMRMRFAAGAFVLQGLPGDFDMAYSPSRGSLFRVKWAEARERIAESLLTETALDKRAALLSYARDVLTERLAQRIQKRLRVNDVVLARKYARRQIELKGQSAIDVLSAAGRDHLLTLHPVILPTVVSDEQLTLLVAELAEALVPSHLGGSSTEGRNRYAHDAAPSPLASDASVASDGSATSDLAGLGGGSSSGRAVDRSLDGLGVVSEPVGGALLRGLRAADVGWVRAVVLEFRRQREVAPSSLTGPVARASRMLNELPLQRERLDLFAVQEVLAAALWRWGPIDPRTIGVRRYAAGRRWRTPAPVQPRGHGLPADLDPLAVALIARAERWVAVVSAAGELPVPWDGALSGAVAELAIRAHAVGALVTSARRRELANDVLTELTGRIVQRRLTAGSFGVDSLPDVFYGAAADGERMGLPVPWRRVRKDVASVEITRLRFDEVASVRDDAAELLARQLGRLLEQHWRVDADRANRYAQNYVDAYNPSALNVLILALREDYLGFEEAEWLAGELAQELMALDLPVFLTERLFRGPERLRMTDALFDQLEAWLDEHPDVPGAADVERGWVVDLTTRRAEASADDRDRVVVSESDFLRVLRLITPRPGAEETDRAIGQSALVPRALDLILVVDAGLQRLRNEILSVSSDTASGEWVRLADTSYLALAEQLLAGTVMWRSASARISTIVVAGILGDVYPTDAILAVALAPRFGAVSVLLTTLGQWTDTHPVYQTLELLSVSASRLRGYARLFEAEDLMSDTVRKLTFTASLWRAESGHRVLDLDLEDILEAETISLLSPLVTDNTDLNVEKVWRLLRTMADWLPQQDGRACAWSVVSLAAHAGLSRLPYRELAELYGRDYRARQLPGVGGRPEGPRPDRTAPVDDAIEVVGAWVRPRLPGWWTDARVAELRAAVYASRPVQKLSTVASPGWAAAVAVRKVLQLVLTQTGPELTDLLTDRPSLFTVPVDGSYVHVVIDWYDLLLSSDAPSSDEPSSDDETITAEDVSSDEESQAGQAPPARGSEAAILGQLSESLRSALSVRGATETSDEVLRAWLQETLVEIAMSSTRGTLASAPGPHVIAGAIMRMNSEPRSVDELIKLARAGAVDSDRIRRIMMHLAGNLPGGAPKWFSSTESVPVPTFVGKRLTGERIEFRSKDVVARTLENPRDDRPVLFETTRESNSAISLTFSQLRHYTVEATRGEYATLVQHSRYFSRVPFDSSQVVLQTAPWVADGGDPLFICFEWWNDKTIKLLYKSSLLSKPEVVRVDGEQFGRLLLARHNFKDLRFRPGSLVFVISWSGDERSADNFASDVQRTLSAAGCNLPIYAPRREVWVGVPNPLVVRRRLQTTGDDSEPLNASDQITVVNGGWRRFSRAENADSHRPEYLGMGVPMNVRSPSTAWRISPANLGLQGLRAGSPGSTRLPPVAVRVRESGDPLSALASEFADEFLRDPSVRTEFRRALDSRWAAATGAVSELPLFLFVNAQNGGFELRINRRLVSVNGRTFAMLLAGTELFRDWLVQNGSRALVVVGRTSDAVRYFAPRILDAGVREVWASTERVTNIWDLTRHGSHWELLAETRVQPPYLAAPPHIEQLRP
jgi:hypothetical protein